MLTTKVSGMYNPNYGFSCSPFENTLDQRFLFFSECHEEVIEALLYFVKEKKSFALVCGDVGTGKTMIVHHLLSKLPGSVKPILIPYPDVEYIEILRYIARVLNINAAGKGILDLTDEIKAVLTKANLDGQQVVLIIDEAHILSVGSLEHIRLLSNIEITGNNLLQIMLIGQNELSHKLHRSDMRQLRQRISVNRFLSPMSASETIEYIDHRLRVAGSSFDKRFESACKSLIYKMTGGVPRSINRLCDTALLVCMIEKGDKVTGKVLKKAHDALNSDVIMAPEESKPGRFFSVRQLMAEKLKPAFAAGALVFIFALAFLGYKANLGENLRGWVYGPDSPKVVSAPIARPLPPVSEVKSEEIPQQPPGAEERSPSSSVPDVATIPTSGPAEEPPEVLPKEGESFDNKEVNVMKIDTDLSSVEESGPVPASQEETQANDENSNTDGESAQAPAGDDEVAAESENLNATAQNLQTGGKALAPSGGFTITVNKGDTLRGIAERWFPEDPASGEKSILSANPQIDDGNLMSVGQTLRIPGFK
jgi:general secretion pathway protein A